MDVMMKLTANGAKASSNPSVMETIMDKNMNKALTSNALPTFEDIAFMFIPDKVMIGGRRLFLQFHVAVLDPAETLHDQVKGKTEKSRRNEV